MLNVSKVQANIPASDLQRARAFYADKLGLTPVQEFAGEILMYETTGGTPFAIYRTEYAGKAEHTIAQWHVDDIKSQVDELKSRGVAFEVYDMPGTSWDGEIAHLPGLGWAAWFKDSEGNTMCVDQPETAG